MQFHGKEKIVGSNPSCGTNQLSEDVSDISLTEEELKRIEQICQEPAHITEYLKKYLEDKKN